jgi:uncharacterized protein YcbX
VHVTELWRYPVKSLRGESLASVNLDHGGVQGDRLVHVRGNHGVVTARTRHGLLGLAASTDAVGTIRIDGAPWDDPRSLRHVREAAGAEVELAAYSGPERFDVLPLLVATDGAIGAFGHDSRRLRPNIIIGGVAGDAERNWPGHALQVGEAIIGIESLRTRCIVTTIDPDTGDLDTDVLREINTRFDGKLALNCWVVHGGAIAVGDPVSVREQRLSPPPRGGWILGAPYEVNAAADPASRLRPTSDRDGSTGPIPRAGSRAA